MKNKKKAETTALFTRVVLQESQLYHVTSTAYCTLQPVIRITKRKKDNAS